MSTPKKENVGKPATEEENRADALAATPEKDELQLKREEAAEAGLAHASLNLGQPDEAEAAKAGDTEGSRDESDPNLEAGNSVTGGGVGVKVPEDTEPVTDEQKRARAKSEADQKAAEKKAKEDAAAKKKAEENK